MNVTFEITPLHGDSDLFLSRNDTNRFPTKALYEYRSIKVGSNADHFEFGRTDNDSLDGNFYIGIYGFTYASYSIVANIIRAGAKVESTS